MKVPILLLLVFFTSSFSVPLKPISNQGTFGDDCNHGHFIPKSNLRYNYEATIDTIISGSTPSPSKLILKAILELKTDHNGVGILQIKNPIFKAGIGNDILNSEEHNELASMLQEYPIRFMTCNGVIKSVQAAKEEHISVLNIKRGILSTFQFQIVNKDNVVVNEVDIHGNCTSQYTRKGLYNRPTFTGQKIRQLNNCNQLEKSSSSGWLQSIENMLPNSRDMIRSNSQCHYQFKNNIISRVTCEETHMFRPFSNKTSGAITTVTQNIRSLSDDSIIIVRKNVNFVSVKLHFHKNEEPKISKERLTLEAELIVDNLCKNTYGLLPKESPFLFHKFVTLLKQSNQNDISSIRHLFSDKGHRCRKFFRDAITSCQTEECRSQVADAIAKGYIKGHGAIKFLTSQSFLQYPSERQISDVFKVFTHDPHKLNYKIFRAAALSLGTMINSKCQQIGLMACRKMNAVEVTLDKIKQFLETDSCKVSKQSDMDMLHAMLKAVGNMGDVARDLQPSILQCIQAKNPIPHRLTAIRALRKMKLNDEVKKSLFTLYQNQLEDVEIRTASYLQILKNPSEKDVRDIIANHNRHEVNEQVGAFIYSHLKSISQSNYPANLTIIQQILKTVKVKPFKTEFLRHSKAWQKSYYNGDIMSGFSAEGHLLFSHKSYIPRSAMLNLNTELFGRKFNLESGLRIEGFENTMEALFGEKGYIRNMKFLSRFFKKHSQKNSILSNIMKHRRNKNQNNIDNMANEVDELSNIKDNVLRQHLKELNMNKDHLQMEPAGMAYTNVQGNEICYEDFKGLGFFNKFRNFDAMKNALQMAEDLAQGKNKSFSKSFTFINAAITIPTGVGIPLKLAVNGSAATALEIGSKMNLKGLFIPPRTFSMSGYVRPSATIEISSSMGIELPAGSYGLRMKHNVYASNDVSGNVNYKDNKLQVNLDAPKEQVQLFSVSNQLFQYSNKDEIAIKPVGKKIDKTMCTPTQTILGLQLCANLKFPYAFGTPTAPFFPLTGPSQFALTLQPTDKMLTSYQLEHYFKVSNDYRKIDCRMTLATPNSMIPRNITMVTQVDLDNWMMTKKLILNEKELSGRIHLDRANKTLSLRLLASPYGKGVYLSAALKKYAIVLQANFGSIINSKRLHLSAGLNETGSFYLDTRYNDHNVLLLSGSASIPRRSFIASLQYGMKLKTYQIKGHYTNGTFTTTALYPNNYGANSQQILYDEIHFKGSLKPKDGFAKFSLELPSYRVRPGRLHYSFNFFIDTTLGKAGIETIFSNWYTTKQMHAVVYGVLDKKTKTGRIIAQFPTWKQYSDRQQEFLELSTTYDEENKKASLSISLPSWRKNENEEFEGHIQCLKMNDEIGMEVNIILPEIIPYTSNRIDIRTVFNKLQSSGYMTLEVPSWRGNMKESITLEGFADKKNLQMALNLTVPSWKKPTNEMFSLSAGLAAYHFHFDLFFPSLKFEEQHHLNVAGQLDPQNKHVHLTTLIPPFTQPIELSGYVDPMNKEFEVNIQFPSYRGLIKETARLGGKLAVPDLGMNIFLIFPSWRSMQQENFNLTTAIDRHSKSIEFHVEFPSWKKAGSEFVFMEANMHNMSINGMIEFPSLSTSQQRYAEMKGAVNVAEKAIFINAVFPSWRRQGNEEIELSANINTQVAKAKLYASFPSWKNPGNEKLILLVHKDPSMKKVDITATLPSWRDQPSEFAHVSVVVMPPNSNHLFHFNYILPSWRSYRPEMGNLTISVDKINRYISFETFIPSWNPYRQNERFYFMIKHRSELKLLTITTEIPSFRNDITTPLGSYTWIQTSLQHGIIGMESRFSSWRGNPMEKETFHATVHFNNATISAKLLLPNIMSSASSVYHIELLSKIDRQNKRLRSEMTYPCFLTGIQQNITLETAYLMVGPIHKLESFMTFISWQDQSLQTINLTSFIDLQRKSIGHYELCSCQSGPVVFNATLDTTNLELTTYVEAPCPFYNKQRRLSINAGIQKQNKLAKLLIRYPGTYGNEHMFVLSSQLRGQISNQLSLESIVRFHDYFVGLDRSIILESSFHKMDRQITLKATVNPFNGSVHHIATVTAQVLKEQTIFKLQGQYQFGRLQKQIGMDLTFNKPELKSKFRAYYMKNNEIREFYIAKHLDLPKRTLQVTINSPCGRNIGLAWNVYKDGDLKLASFNVTYTLLTANKYADLRFITKFDRKNNIASAYTSYICPGLVKRQYFGTSLMYYGDMMRKNLQWDIFTPFTSIKTSFKLDLAKPFIELDTGLYAGEQPTHRIGITGRYIQQDRQVQIDAEYFPGKHININSRCWRNDEEKGVTIALSGNGLINKILPKRLGLRIHQVNRIVVLDADFNCQKMSTLSLVGKLDSDIVRVGLFRTVNETRIKELSLSYALKGEHGLIQLYIRPQLAPELIQHVKTATKMAIDKASMKLNQISQYVMAKFKQYHQQCKAMAKAKIQEIKAKVMAQMAVFMARLHWSKPDLETWINTQISLYNKKWMENACNKTKHLTHLLASKMNVAHQVFQQYLQRANATLTIYTQRLTMKLVKVLKPILPYIEKYFNVTKFIKEKVMPMIHYKIFPAIQRGKNYATYKLMKIKQNIINFIINMKQKITQYTMYITYQKLQPMMEKMIRLAKDLKKNPQQTSLALLKLMKNKTHQWIIQHAKPLLANMELYELYKSKNISMEIYRKIVSMRNITYYKDTHYAIKEWLIPFYYDLKAMIIAYVPQLPSKDQFKYYAGKIIAFKKALLFNIMHKVTKMASTLLDTPLWNLQVNKTDGIYQLTFIQPIVIDSLLQLPKEIVISPTLQYMANQTKHTILTKAIKMVELSHALIIKIKTKLIPVLHQKVALYMHSKLEKLTDHSMYLRQKLDYLLQKEHNIIQAVSQYLNQKLNLRYAELKQVLESGDWKIMKQYGVKLMMHNIQMMKMKLMKLYQAIKEKMSEKCQQIKQYCMEKLPVKAIHQMLMMKYNNIKPKIIYMLQKLPIDVTYWRYKLAMLLDKVGLKCHRPLLLKGEVEDSMQCAKESLSQYKELMKKTINMVTIKTKLMTIKNKLREKFVYMMALMNKIKNQPIKVTFMELKMKLKTMLMQWYQSVQPNIQEKLQQLGLGKMIEKLNILQSYMTKRAIIQILADIRTHMRMQAEMIYTQSPAQTVMRIKTTVGYLWAKVAKMISAYTEFITNMKYDDLKKYYQLHIAQTNMGQKIQLLISKCKAMCQKMSTITKAKMEIMMEKIHFGMKLLMDKGNIYLPKLAQIATTKLRLMIQNMTPGLEYHYDQLVQTIAIKSKMLKSKFYQTIHDIKLHSAIMKEFLIALRDKLTIKFHRMMNYTIKVINSAKVEIKQILQHHKLQMKDKCQKMKMKLFNIANIFIDVAEWQAKAKQHCHDVKQQWNLFYNRPLVESKMAYKAKMDSLYQYVLDKVVPQYPEIAFLYTIGMRFKRGFEMITTNIIKDPKGSYHNAVTYFKQHNTSQIIHQIKQFAQWYMTTIKQVQHGVTSIIKKVYYRHVLPKLMTLAKQDIPNYVYQVAKKCNRQQELQQLMDYANITVTVIQTIQNQPYQQSAIQLYDYASEMIDYQWMILKEYYFEDYLQLTEMHPNLLPFLLDVEDNFIAIKNLTIRLYHQPRLTIKQMLANLMENGIIATSRQVIVFSRDTVYYSYHISKYIMARMIVPTTLDIIYYQIPEYTYRMVKGTCMERYYNMTIDHVLYTTEQLMILYDQPFNATMEQLQDLMYNLHTRAIQKLLLNKQAFIKRFPEIEPYMDTMTQQLGHTYQMAVMVYRHPTQQYNNIYHYLKTTQCKMMAKHVMTKTVKVANFTTHLVKTVGKIVKTVIREDVTPVVYNAVTTIIPKYARQFVRNTSYEGCFNKTITRLNDALLALKELYNTPIYGTVHQAMKSAMDKMEQCPHMRNYINKMTPKIKQTYQTLAQLYQTPINQTIYQLLYIVQNKLMVTRDNVYQRYPELQIIVQNILNKINHISYVLKSTYQQPLNDTAMDIYDYVANQSIHQMVYTIMSRSMALTKFTRNVACNLTQVAKRIILKELMPTLHQFVSKKLQHTLQKWPILNKPINMTINVFNKGAKLFHLAINNPLHVTIDTVKNTIIDSVDRAINVTYDKCYAIYNQGLEKTFDQMKAKTIMYYQFIKPTLKHMLFTYYNLTDTYVPKVHSMYQKAMLKYLAIKNFLANMTKIARNYSRYMKEYCMNSSYIQYIIQYIYQPMLDKYPIDQLMYKLKQKLYIKYNKIVNITQYWKENSKLIKTLTKIYNELSKFNMDSIDLDRIPYYISKLQLPKCMLGFKLLNWTQIVDKIVNNVNKKIPRYERTAMIYSDTSIMTFDGEHVTIPPYKSKSCSYLLTHDYVNNSFTITSRQDSIFVRVRNGDNIVLEKTGIVYVNDRMVELPQQMQDFNATRVGPFVYINASSGLNIRCDLDHYLCLFNVPSWYHNRVVGLLGNMDGEKSNDWRSMKKKFVPNAITLADSWEVSGSSKCLHTPFVQDTNSNTFDVSSDNKHDTMMISIKPRKIANNKCSDLSYNKDNKHCMKLDRNYESQLSRCFDVIDPTDFRDVCLHEICGKKCSDNQCGCNIFAAYIQRCEKAGINITMPGECSLCDNKYNINDTWKAKSKRLDVVIVAHEVPEMKNYGKYMEKLFRSLEIFVSKHRNLKTRFGLVGFGGDSVHSDAHYHTLNGQLKGRIDDLRRGLKFLNFTKRTNDDTIAALQFALQYPFDSDYKAIILVTDSEPMKSVDLTTIREDLHYNGVILNVIKRPQQIKESPIAFEGTAIDNMDMLVTDDAYSHIIKRGYVWNANYVTSQFASFHKSFLKYFDFDLKNLQKNCFKCQCKVGLAQQGQTSCQLC